VNGSERGVEAAIEELKEKISELSDFVEIYSLIARDSIIFHIDRKGNFISLKRGDMPLSSLNGKSFLSVVTKEDKKNAADYFMKCLEGDKIHITVKINKNSGEGTFDIAAIPKKKGGKIDGVQGIASETAVQNNLESLLDLINDPMCVSDLLGNIITANQQCNPLFGYEEVTKKNIFDLIDEEYVPSVREQIRLAMTGNYRKGDVYIINKEGIKIPAEIDVQETGDNKLLFVVREATHKKIMELEVEEMAERKDDHFRKIKEKLSAVHNIGNITSRQELYQETTHAIMEFFGADSCFLGMLSDGKINMVAGEGQEAGNIFNDKRISSILESDMEIHAKSGESGIETYIPLSYNKKVLGVIGIVSKNAFSDEDFLLLGILSQNVVKSILYLEDEASLARQRETIYKAVEGIYRTTFDGRIIDANPAFVKIFGYEGREEELRGINAEHLFLKPEDRKKFLEILEKEERVQHFETRYVTRDRKIIFGRESAWVIPYDDKKVIEGIFQDIRHQRSVEEDARFYNSLLRHDIYNKNEIAIGYLGLLGNSGLSEKDTGIVKKAVMAITDGNKLIEAVKKLEVIRDKKELTGIALDDVMDSIISHYTEEANKRDIKINYMDTGAVVRGNELVEDVFSNLIKNAVEHSYGRYVNIYAKDDKEGWNIYVEDDGVGLSDENKDKIFQQGWKGKGSSGSGLGLYLVKKIVEGFDGKISVESGENEFPEGCRFIVWLRKEKRNEKRNTTGNGRDIIGHESKALGIRW